MATKLNLRHWPEISRSSLNRRIAGAGALGTGLAIFTFVVGMLFLMMESHFLMMFSFSLMPLFYSAGSQLSIVIADSIKLTFSTKHIDAKSTQILESMEEL